MTPQIRQLEESDYYPIISVLDEWWGGRRMAAMLPRLFFKHFRETSFLVEIDGKIAGFLVGFLSPTHASEAYIHFIGIHPGFRKIGIGRALYQRFNDSARRHGRKIVRCVTSPVNTGSIAFHHQMGFQIEPSASDHIHRNYDGPGADRVLFFREI